MEMKMEMEMEMDLFHTIQCHLMIHNQRQRLAYVAVYMNPLFYFFCLTRVYGGECRVRAAINDVYFLVLGI
jgi:hypothetical protein